MTTRKKIIVIGGGPAGLMAAGQAAKAGAKVILLEKMKLAGRKLCITGKGRCNITNIADIADFIAHFHKTGKFLRQAFANFFNKDLVSFLEGEGLEVVYERGGRVFPKSNKAQDVLKALTKWVSKCGVELRTSVEVSRLLFANGKVTGVLLANGTEIGADAVILATGGKSYPKTGSTGDGYRLAAEVGHQLIPLRPALVPLETTGSYHHHFDGLNLRNVKVKMLVNGKKKREEFGEVVFTEFGLSGPVILTLSGDIVDLLIDKNKVELSIDLKPALDEKKLDARLIRDFASRGQEPMSSILRGLMPKEMVAYCLKEVGIDEDTKGNVISKNERRQIKNWLKDLRIKVIGHRPIDEAIVTAGGIDTKEVDPRSMESRILKGLYLAGEVLDVQADTGGYNLQAAFSTGWLAGRSSVEQH